MRILRFLVDGQKIDKNPECDFTNLIPGTKGYIQAEFEFSEEWDRCEKVAQFSSGNIEYEPQIINNQNYCKIPEAVLARPSFMVKVYGAKSGEYTIVTNKIAITQDGGSI